MCSLPFFTDDVGGGEMIARELYDPPLFCLFFLWGTSDFK